MKPLITSFASLLLGVFIGWYFEHRHAERKMTDVVEQMQQPVVSSDREKAVRAVRAIECIQAGDRSNAVRLLSRTVGDFYYFYAGLTHNDERTRQTLAWVEQVASTNAVVADAIHNTNQ